MEIYGFTRLLLVRAQEWGLPVHVGKGDAHKAFDSIEHVTLDQALEMRGVPLALRCACLRELVDIVLIVSLQNTFSEPVELRKGGKQGGSETPTFFGMSFLTMSWGPWYLNGSSIVLELAWGMGRGLSFTMYGQMMPFGSRRTGRNLPG